MADLKHIDRMLAEEEISLFTQLPFLGPNEKKAYRTFACHAAFPLVLTTDLLFNLWMNFAEDENGEQLHIPREAVSDFLLSGICSKVGHKTYEVKPQMRELLLNELLQDLVFGPQRIRKLADFTLLYVRERLDEENLLERTIGEVLRWGALAYVRPEEAAERMAQALAKSLHHKDRSGQLRMHHLMEKLSGPMQRFDAFRDLRKFASGVARNVAGKGEAAETAFAEMDKQQINIGKVTLEAPETKKVQPPICFFGYITSPPQESKSMTVLDFDDEHRRIIPYFRRLEEKGLIRIVVQYDLRPVEIENILTDPSYAGEICFLHLSGHASTHGNPVGEQMPQQQSSQSASFGSYSAGFNPDNSLISWRSLSAIFEAHSQLQLISLDDVLTSDQLGDFRNDLETRMNKVFNPQLPQLVRNRNLLVIDHNEVEIDFMPFLEAFYDKLTLNETLNNSFNEASEETLGQLLRLKRKPVMSWLSNGWWQLSEHPYLQPDMFKLDAIPRLSPEDARLLSNIGEIYNAREEFVGFGVLIDGGQFVTSYYYLTGEEGEYIQFYQQDEWKKFTYREMDLIRDENYNAAWILKLTAVDGGNLDPFSILDSASEEDMPGGEWSLTLLEPRWDEKKNPSLKRYELDAYVERYSLYYEEDALDSLAGLPLLIKGRLAGYHFGEMSGSSTEKTGVWWPGVHTRLREKLSSQRPKLGRIQELESKLETQDDNLEILNELAKAYRESENHGPEDAIPLLERALRLEPNNTFSLNEYGIQLRESGRVEEAINTFERALKTDPKNTFTINELAYTFGESLKNEEQAKKLYEQSLEIQPENIFALTHLARVEADLFNWENAEALIGQALEIAPENEDALAVQLIIRENKQQESGEEQTLQIESIREHLQRGDIEMALNLLEKLETGQSLPEGKIQILRARYLQTARQFSQGVITTQENEVQLNQISSQIMSLLQTVQEQVEGTSPSTGLSEQANNLEKQLESLTKQDSAQAREILHELSAVYQQLISQDKEEEYWRRQYGLTLERLGDLEVDEGNYEDAENHFQRAIVFFRNLQLNQQEKDWVNIAAAIAHEHLGDVRQLTADVNTALTSYDSAIKQLEKLSERNPEHEDLGPTSTVLADKVAQMLEKAERYREADSYRNRLEVLFASSDSASQLQNLVKSILSDDFDKAVNELAAFAESGQNSKRFLPQISRIESDWTSLTGSAPNEECQKFVDQKFRLDLIEILLQIEPETEKLITLTEDRRNLFGAVLTYAEEDLPKRRPAAVVFLFESFKASFSPNNQETLENILRDWENISQRPAKRGGNRYGEITDRLQRLVQDAQFLNQPRSSTEEPDVQSELNRIIEMTAEIPHEEYLKAMDNFPVAQLPEELRGKWEKEIIPRLEDLRKNIESDYENLELVMKLNQEIQELLFDIRQELFPI